MGTIKRFEEIKAWQRARAFSQKIYLITLEGSFAKDYALKDQINKSSGSVMDNIAEGFDRGGRREFINFLSYARGSTGESRSQIYRALDRGHIKEQEFASLNEDALEIGSMISGFMIYLQKSEFRGVKFL